MGVEAHNRVLAAGRARAEKLEPRLAAVLRPILAHAGVDAAAAFRRRAYVGIAASGIVVTAAGGLDVQSNSTMICVKPRPDEAAAIADPDGMPADVLHVTLAYLGEIDGDLAPVVDALAPVAGSHGPLEGVVGGYGEFRPPGVGILLPDVPGLVELRVAATEALARAGISYGREHGFQPHISVDGSPEDGEIDYMLDRAAGLPLHFDELLIVRGDTEIHPLPLVGPRPITAAGTPEPPRWHKPAPDELIDAQQLVSTLRTKTDPVRQAVVHSVMGEALTEHGIAFDTTNPLTAQVLSQTGSHIVEIADTTQANVMRIISAAYDEGLTIADTAKAIRVGMADAAGERATVIARTELAGAVNGGSLAATQIVADETGDRYVKRWLTAPGARFPRHETYEGLDGQTTGLSGTFDVGGAQLQFPGDPNGPPEETIQCFSGETLVEMPGLRAVMRRWYEGDLVRVSLASGDVLAATPNHPVLRSDGEWVPIGMVEQGDYLVSTLLGRDDAGTPDPDCPPSEIRETYRLASIGSFSERVCLAPPDLHGDGAYGEVDVVTVDGDLVLDIDAASDEEVVELGLALAAKARACTSGVDHSLAVFDRTGRHLERSASRGVGISSQGTALGGAHMLHPQEIRGRSTTNEESHFLEAPNNYVAADPEMLAYRQDALAAFVTLAQIIKVEINPFHGYVYNLDTGAGWYTAGTIACRNCRCTVIYDTPDGQEEVSAEDG